MAIRVTRAGVWLTVGIIVLTGAVLGGLYIAAQRGEKARRDEAIAIAEKNLQEQSKNDTALNQGSGTSGEDSTNESATGQSGSSGSTESNGATGGTSSSNSASPNNSASQQATVSELPQTGPVSGLFAALVGGIVTYAVIAYVRSRNATVRMASR